MNLILLYGPPAVGKLTVAKELEKRLDYKLLHNHMLINMVENLFSHEHPARRKLVREFRLRILEEAVGADINLITTSGMAGSPTLFDYYTELIATVEKKGGQIHLVHLTADGQTLLDRVEHDFRRKHGKNFGKEEMQRMLDTYTILFDKYPNRDHLSIDTRKTQPSEAAEQIITHYKLQ